MNRRDFITLLGGAAIWPLAARAQQGERVRRVGILLSAAATEVEYQGYLAAFVQEMRRLGWSEGQNLQIDVRWNAGDAALSRTYAAQLIGLMPDVIVAGSTVNLLTVQQATNTIPIVFVQVADPVTQGFVSNMRHVGGLLEYGANFDLARHYGQAATYVDRILKGARPGDLPVQAPTKYKLTINLKTAKALDLNVPLPLLGLADEVIE